MNTLCYVGKPQQWESPKGVILRTAYHNGYSNVATMCSALGVPYSGDSLELLTEQSSLFNKLTMEAPELTHYLLANSYTVNNSAQPLWIIDEVTLYRSQFAFHLRYCPECLRNELITVFQDIRDLVVCPIHGTFIVTHCPDCHAHEHWTTANLLFCKCGSDRRRTKPLSGGLFEADRLETFGPYADIRELSYMTNLAQKCEDIWISRKSNDEVNKCLFVSAILKHATKMITIQHSKYPGFTRSMHLSPWQTSHPLLIKLANAAFKEPSALNSNCKSGLCCADVKLMRCEIAYSVGDWKACSKNSTFISDNFKIIRNNGVTPYYQCQTPICRLIRLARDSILNHEAKNDDCTYHYKAKNDDYMLHHEAKNDDYMLHHKAWNDVCMLHHKAKNKSTGCDYLSIEETITLLHCSKNTVLQLVELGYLQRPYQPRGLVQPHTNLIEKTSTMRFNNNFILPEKISQTLQTTTVQTIRLLNQLGINSTHNKLGPRVYEKSKILSVLDKLTDTSKNPPLLYPIVFPPTQQLDNTIRIANAYIKSFKYNTSLPSSSIASKSMANNSYRFTTSMAAKILNISSRLLYHRFILTGLITPEVMKGTPYYSEADIRVMDAHLQKHLSIEQATKLLQCGCTKAIRLINNSKIKPSRALVYSNGDIQLLYRKADIQNLRQQKNHNT